MQYEEDVSDEAAQPRASPPMARASPPMVERTTAEIIQNLRAELVAAQSENQMLLEQMTRLCVYIENTNGVDPIEVMHGRVKGEPETPESRPYPAPPPPPPMASALPPTAQAGFLRGLLSRAGLAKEQPARAGSGVDASGVDASGGASSSGAGGVLADGAVDGVGIDEDGPPMLIAGGSFEWRGDPENLSELERKLGESRLVAEINLDGTSLTRLPSSLAVWSHLSNTLSQISLNGNGLVELPSAFSRLRGLRKLFLEGNLLREVPAPVLELKRLEELGMGCNQLTGLPEAFGALVRLAELWLVSNEISYLPQSFGQLTSLRKLEMSANALHELPRSFGKLTGLTHLWMASNSLSVFPQHLCALDNLEHLDLHSNMLMTIPRAVGTMPALKTLVLEKNPMHFPPAGVLSQGPAAVLEYIRRHRHTDLMTTDAERSLKQVLAYRDRLANTIDVYEETHRHLKGSGAQAADDDAVSLAGTDAGGGAADSPTATAPRRTRNANFFD